MTIPDYIKTTINALKQYFISKEDVSNIIESVDESKQDKLTPGKNIEIKDNIVSWKHPDGYGYEKYAALIDETFNMDEYGNYECDDMALAPDMDYDVEINGIMCDDVKQYIEPEFGDYGGLYGYVGNFSFFIETGFEFYAHIGKYESGVLTDLYVDDVHNNVWFEECKHDIIQGETYTVTINDTVYEDVQAVSVTDSDGYTYAYIGDPFYDEYPFYSEGYDMWFPDNYFDGQTVHVKIEGSGYAPYTGRCDVSVFGNRIVQFDPKFIPDKKVLPELSEGDAGSIPMWDGGSWEPTLLYAHIPDVPVRYGSGEYSVCEGINTTASGYGSHAEGSSTTATFTGSHAEGCATTAKGISSHAEGWSTTTSGNYSHAEGYYTNVAPSGNYSHAEGYYTTASGSSSHAEGGQHICKRFIVTR